MAFHGVLRNTGDMDIWVGPGHQNAERLLMALDDFGFGSIGQNAQDFIEPDRGIQLGMVPSRVNLLTSISGVAWPDAWLNKQSARYASVPVYILSRDSFLENKRSTGRPKDLADIALLEGRDGDRGRSARVSRGAGYAGHNGQAA